ncbi:MAG: DUF554 domain-containing protein [Oscillospiraceae bacterium]|nr:DUF554 domain-containing protein [Oscillospiraceae bacterium]
MLGTLINVALVLLGGGLGLWVGRYIAPRFRDTVMQGLGLCVMLIGLDGALGTADVLAVILCVVLGALLGEGINIEKRLESLGTMMERAVARGQKPGGFVRGFTAASLLFCVGAMSIVGPLESGLSGNHTTQIAKGVMDGVASVFLAAALGPGVLGSALVIFLYQGGITLGATFLAPLLTDAIVREMSAVGGLVIVGIGLNMLEITRIRVGNLLPAILLPMGYVPLAAWLGSIL